MNRYISQVCVQTAGRKVPPYQPGLTSQSG